MNQLSGLIQELNATTDQTDRDLIWQTIDDVTQQLLTESLQQQKSGLNLGDLTAQQNDTFQTLYNTL